MARFDRINNQAPAEQELQADKINVGRTALDFSCIHNGNAMIGALTPVDCFDVVPNEDIDISMSALLEFRNPSTRQLFNGMRVYFHAYYNRLTDLWEGAKNWIDNGRRGNISLTRPMAMYKVSGTIRQDTTKNVTINACTPMSLLNYLGLPAETYHVYSQSQEIVSPLHQFKPTFKDEYNFTYGNDSIVPAEITTNAKLSNDKYDTGDYFPADCCMAYQRNWRDFYCNKNLLQSNDYWFPNNEEHFILSYNCTLANQIFYEFENALENQHSPFDSEEWQQYRNSMLGLPMGDRTTNPYSSLENFKISREINNPATNNDGQSFLAPPNLFGLKFRQFRGDRFTASSPFPDLIRGDVPILNSSMDAITAHFNNAHTNVSTMPNLRATNQVVADLLISQGNVLQGDNFTSSVPNNTKMDIVGISGDVNIPLSSLNITMSDIYTLETLTTFRRRLGLTNGDYNEMIKSQYGVSPNVHDRKGTYIGGFYQDFAFSSVTQSSESTIDSPLGQKAGQGVSSGTGTIGHFHTPDFGWIQIYMSIVPDVYYTQGKPRMFSKKSNLEMYFPLFNNLPAQAIRNDELYNTDSVSDNEAPFSYEDRYAEYKSRTNRVSGLMGLPHSIATYDASRVIARRFDSSPAFNSTFVTMIPENVDMNVFAVVDEPPFDFSIGIACRRVSPMPYTAIEGSLSSPTLNSMGA